MTTTPVRKRGTRKVISPQFQEPLISQADPGRPTEHNAIPVVREELFANLPNGAPFKISKLHLADGTAAFACRECSFTADKRSDVQRHRNEQHNAYFHLKRPKMKFPKPASADLMLPPREDGSAAPESLLAMTIAELMALMPNIGALSDYIDEKEAEVAHLRELLALRDEQSKQDQHAVAVYPSLQEEVVELRLKLKGVGSFDEMKDELLELRTWKKKIVARLKTLGFVLSEEEE